MFRRKILSILLSAGMVASNGCSVFQSKQQHVTITASEPNARIFLNNDPVGTGTVSLLLDRNKTYAISATSGGRTGTAAIGRKVSGTGVLDIIGGCFFLVPFVGCFTPGFWELSPTTVSVSIPASIAQSPDKADDSPNTAANPQSRSASVR